MSKRKPERTTPKIAGSQVYGQGELAALQGNTVFIHRQKYHVFVGVQEVLVTENKAEALAEAAKMHNA